VQNRQHQTGLCEDEYAQIEAEWQGQLEELRMSPLELKLIKLNNLNLR
jgi:hypothetical protein